MSKEAFVQFRDAVMKSSPLQAELVNTVKSQADLVAMGKRLGFEVEAADLQSQALTEEELRHVAGGSTLSGIALASEPKGWTTLEYFEKWTQIVPLGIRDQILK